jgi:hypothetical protein
MPCEICWIRVCVAVNRRKARGPAVAFATNTALQAYAALQVPELWRYHNRTLQIFVLRDGTYVLSPESPTFPHIPVVEGMTQFVEMRRTVGTAPALRALRQWVREHVQP